MHYFTKSKWISESRDIAFTCLAPSIKGKTFLTIMVPSFSYASVLLDKLAIICGTILSEIAWIVGSGFELLKLKKYGSSNFMLKG